MSQLGPKSEQLLFHFVDGVSMEEILQTVRENAPNYGVTLTPEIEAVIKTLVNYYQANSQDNKIQDAYRNMLFLEHAYAAQGGHKYLVELFPTGEGVINSIHELAGFPSLQDTDQGFGTVI